MKAASMLLAAAAATALLAAPAEAKQRPRWEVGIGAFGTYDPDYIGSSESSFSGFPVVYFAYRGEDFSILRSGLYDVAADDTSRFSFGFSFDLGGNIDSADRLNLGDIDTVVEVGPEIAVALFANGRSRLEIGLAARVAYSFDQDYVGWVLQPRLAYLTTLGPDTRLGIYVAPRFAYDDYNDLYYSTPGFDAQDGYVATDIGLKLVNDISDRFRVSGEVKAISVSGAENDDSPLVTEDWNFTARIGFTYVIWQSDEMTSD